MNLSQYLTALTNTQSIEALWDMHTRKMASYGFDRLLYGFTRYRSGNSLGDPEDYVVLSNHKAEYTDVFMGQGLYSHAPMVRWVLENEGACSWSILGQMTEEGALSEAERKVIAFNQTMDVTAGYSISFESISPRSKGAIALTAQSGLSQDEVDAIWHKHGEDILVINNVAHLKIMTLPYSGPSRQLTKRQREALEWWQAGR